MTSISPWGLSGPKRDWRAEDLTVWSAGGVCVLNGGGPEHPELPPLKTFGQQAGFQGGVHGAVATMGAVFAQVRDGEGQHVDVSMSGGDRGATRADVRVLAVHENDRDAARAEADAAARERCNARTATSTSAASRSISGAISSS